MIKTREPQNEYIFPEKEAYRESVWSTFAKHIAPSTARVLFYPGRHGLEIPIALKHGFKEENLIACEMNKALLINSEWRKIYPQVRLYGTPLLRTIERLESDKIKLDAVNLDYCSNLCQPIFTDVKELLKSKCVKWPFFIAVTMLKGREWCEFADIARMICPQEDGTIDRIGVVMALIRSWNYLVKPILNKEYRSDNKFMNYGIFGVTTEQWLKDEWRRFFDLHHNEVKTLIGLDTLRCEAKTLKEFQCYSDAFITGRRSLKEQEQKYSERFRCWPQRKMYYLTPEYDSIRDVITLDNIPWQRRNRA